VNVSARAVATVYERQLPYALMVMSESGCRTFELQNGEVNITQGGATYTRSSCDSGHGALRGSGGDLTSGGNDVVGSWTNNGNSDFEPEPQHAPWIEDPLGHLPQPTGAGLPVFPGQQANNNTTLNLTPGIYTGQIRVNSGGRINLAAGTYILQGGLRVNGGLLTSNGEEVLLYATCDP